MQKSSHVCAAAQTETSVDQALAIIRISGVVDESAIARVLVTCEADLAAWRPAGMVACYDAAKLAVDAGHLMDTARSIMRPESALRVPTALVVQPSDLEFWRIYCDLQGRRGVLRAAFVDQEKARAWAAEHAALWNAQARWRRG
jgi:hypothetical protein